MGQSQLEIRFALSYTAPHRARALAQKMEEMRLDVFQDVIERPPTYRFDIWDFAGQHMYYTSHQTFLSERAIYLLVVDMSIPLDEELSTEIEVAKWKEASSPKRARGTSFSHYPYSCFIYHSLRHSNSKRLASCTHRTTMPCIILRSIH